MTLRRKVVPKDRCRTNDVYRLAHSDRLVEENGIGPVGRNHDRFSSDHGSMLFVEDCPAVEFVSPRLCQHQHTYRIVLVATSLVRA